VHAAHLRCLVGGRGRTAGLVGDADQVTVLGQVQPIDDPTQAHAVHAASIINGQRRRSLNYQSPAALYAAAAVQ